MAAWLDLVNEDGAWTLVDTSRLEELVQGMPSPKRQSPSLVYFAGSSNRLKALRALIPHNNVTRKGPAGWIRLHLCGRSGHTETPVLFAESSLLSEKSQGDSRWSTHHASHRHRRYAIPDAESVCSPAKLHQEVKAQLILPWTQILCLFIDSKSDLQSARNLLQQPRRQLAIGGQPVSTSMRIVIVLTKQDDSHPTSARQFADFEAFAETGETVVLDLRPRCGLSETVAFEPLRTLIVEQLSAIRDQQESTCRRISASHLAAFWKSYIQSYKRSLNAPRFDLLIEARRGYPDDKSMGRFLREGAHTVMYSGCAEDEMHVFVASAFLMHAYPPGMHGFSPPIVFAALYEKHCVEISQNGASDGHSDGILSYFSQQFLQLDTNNTSAIVRKNVLHRFFCRWGGLQSTTTCLVCLCRPPEHMMPCKHALCDTCVVIFGKSSSSGEYHWDLTECPVCGEPFLVSIRQLPPTKHPVILSLDGGGVRGLIQLGLLQALEKRIGLPIASLPDLCLGTSVGALTAIDIFLNHSSVENCVQAFPDLARKIFRRSRGPVPRFVRWLASAFNLIPSSLYNSQGLSQTFREVVGLDRRLFDVNTANPAGCRIAVVVSRTSDGKACVLANYRGTGPRRGNSAYQFLAPDDEQENPFLCDIAECSVAAPFYFQPGRLPGFGSFQDGGVRANNPLAIALRESGIIWPRAKRHDLLLSVGTGFTAPALDHGLRHKAWDGALPRLFRATMSSPSMDGQQGFSEALNYLPHGSKPDVLRLDQAIPAPLPELDDISALQELSEMKILVPDELVRMVLASAMFFFEFDATPVPGPVGFHCEGSILCSRPGVGEILARISIEIPGAKFQAGRDQVLGDVDLHDCCNSCGYYRKRVAFHIASLEERFSINIVNGSCCEKIGGFPKSAEEFLDAQQAFAHFGRADHQTPSWPPVRHCYCAYGVKRTIRFLEPSSRQKRRRL
ncbi:hypothetical protein N7466_001510 [Penicillium verhagenii]|uniref:uncharacterized protein n=1 Tax=Penicillium verhagenii TaxID=1562060 RepID=UPI002545BAF3|nr:uncharacterized protein N7466_001510 [Penicillium verhagenii]KAJ5938376.1 hypothetical protein N7466_001510 [Penicillium verhagenii]